MQSTQLLKDTFYATMRDRIATNNPARTTVVRGILRPGIVVAENELPGAAVDGIAPADTFSLRWTALAIDTQSALPLLSMTCEIRYATDGSTSMDRGRALTAMDAELATAIGTAPQSANTLNIAEIAGGGVSTNAPTGTKVFWGDAQFKPATMRGERMERIVEVEVFSYGQ